ERARMLVIGTYRPVELIVRGHALLDIKRGLLGRRACRELPLELLTEQDVNEYLVERLGTARASRTLARHFFRRTDGNPLFLVNLLDDYVARALDGADQAIEGLHIPESIQQAIARQIDRRGTEAREVLEAASVAGMEFTVAAVAAALGQQPDAVEPVC